MGRATQGVRLITLKGNDEIASVAKIEHDEEEEMDDVIVADGEVVEPAPETESAEPAGPEETEGEEPAGADDKTEE